MNWYLLAAIPVLGLLVLVHEFGHFIAAKWAGIRVEEFGLGLPPRIVGVRKRETGGWEIVWLSGRSAEENDYQPQQQGMSRLCQERYSRRLVTGPTCNSDEPTASPRTSQ